METKKIIHLDNSGMYRKMVSRFLTGEGFEVESYEKWGDAAITVNRNPPAMVITGLTLADGTGPELIERITGVYSGPLVVLSSNVDESEAARLKALGVTAAIVKSGEWESSLKVFLKQL
jgi:DNA-binding response OmpR family regulator